MRRRPHIGKPSNANFRWPLIATCHCVVSVSLEKLALRFLDKQTSYSMLQIVLLASNCTIQDRQVGPQRISNGLALAIWPPANSFLKSQKVRMAMKKTLMCCFIALLSLVSPAWSQAQTTGETEKAVAALEQQWLQSQKTNNPDLVARCWPTSLLVRGLMENSPTGPNRWQTRKPPNMTAWNTKM
jgi:hypothetical protein